ncbi:hypothetical protein D3C87_2029990 [compost metagenome]
MAAHFGQFRRIGLGLDAFGHHLHVEVARHRDDRAQQNRPFFTAVADQRLVELDRVEREAGQIGE